MRHRRKGRKLGRNPNHQRALLRNLATALILTERDASDDDNKPKVKGRIITTLQKAKEVRPLVERCITIARRALPHLEAADALGRDAERHSEKWRAWRHSERWSAVEPGDGPRGGRPPPRCCGCWATSRRCDPLRRHCPALRRSPRRLHPRPAAWPSRGWATPARGPSSSWSASATASAAAPPEPSFETEPEAAPEHEEPSAEAAGKSCRTRRRNHVSYRVALLACPAVPARRFPAALLDKPAVPPTA